MGRGSELALEELVDDTLTVDLEGLGEGVEVEGAGEGVSQTERKHERDPAAGILERPAPALTNHHRLVAAQNHHQAMTVVVSML